MGEIPGSNPEDWNSIIRRREDETARRLLSFLDDIQDNSEVVAFLDEDVPLTYKIARVFDEIDHELPNDSLSDESHQRIQQDIASLHNIQKLIENSQTDTLEATRPSDPYRVSNGDSPLFMFRPDSMRFGDRNFFVAQHVVEKLEIKFYNGIRTLDGFLQGVDYNDERYLATICQPGFRPPGRFKRFTFPTALSGIALDIIRYTTSSPHNSEYRLAFNPNLLNSNVSRSSGFQK